MSEAQLAGALERATAAEEVASKYSSDVQRISEQVTKLEADKVCGPSQPKVADNAAWQIHCFFGCAPEEQGYAAMAATHAHPCAC